MPKHPEDPQWGLVITMHHDPDTGGWRYCSQIHMPDGSTDAAPTTEWVAHHNRTWRLPNLLAADLNLVEGWAAYQAAGYVPAGPVRSS